MICPFCKEEIADGAIKCKHCSSMLTATASATGAATASATNTATGPVQDIQAIEEHINASSRKDSIKDRFRLFAANGARSKFFGPEFTSPVAWTKYANWWALLFNCWYYIFTGMWKKGLSMMGIAIVVSTVLGVIHPRYGQFGALLTAGICLMSANYDRYRKEILGEDFWW